jgi:8-oxo-dGTP pyrophosphatase MutT (NUDIX family)
MKLPISAAMGKPVGRAAGAPAFAARDETAADRPVTRGGGVAGSVPRWPFGQPIDGHGPHAESRSMACSYPFTDALRTTLAERLRAFEAAGPSRASTLKRAAVVIGILPLEHAAGDATAEAAFLLIRRAELLRAHGGQLALPGGRLDDGEAVVDAALRELQEELGILVDQDAALGILDDYPTRSGYLISPVVVWLPPGASPAPNPHEVAEVYRLPLAELCRSDSPEIFAIPESERPVIRLPMPLIGTQINAPTAAMLYQFRVVGLEGRMTRVDHFDQPVWAWR